MNVHRTEKRLNRQQVKLSDTEIEILKDWQFGNRIPSMGAAIREALRLGLKSELKSDLGPHFQD